MRRRCRAPDGRDKPANVTSRRRARPWRRDAGAFELATQARQEARGNLLEPELQTLAAQVLPEEGEDVGELDEFLVEEMFLDHGLAALERGESGPGLGALRIARPDGHDAVQAGPLDAGGKFAEALVGVGDVGEARLPQQGIALVEQLVEVHARISGWRVDVPARARRVPAPSSGAQPMPCASRMNPDAIPDVDLTFPVQCR